jgi:hypothetical protein
VLKLNPDRALVGEQVGVLRPFASSMPAQASALVSVAGLDGSRDDLPTFSA